MVYRWPAAHSFNVYVLEQRRVLRKTREVLVNKLVQDEASEQLALMDALTELLNRPNDP